ncbi:MAG: glycoside hydrolase family 10 protein [Gemmatimonadaceae bacterium]
MRLAIALLALPFQAMLSQTVADSLRPPPVTREFRGVWVATVRNMDWPSRPDLSTSEQQQELLAILDRASSLKLNAIVFQVRTEADALYDSKLEPWSRYLTGEQGRKPDPLWDPLEFAVTEGHKRGLEVHAWFNPYRAAYRRDEPTASTHVSKRRRNLVVPYAQYLWMDPSKTEVRQMMLRVILDVVRRYDVDGVHIDDYFYPYPETAAGETIPFPDAASYNAYKRGGGRLDRAHWRRRNVDALVSEFYQAVKREKVWVKVGISPFGIWRPGFPPTTTAGLDQYDELYADARKWWREGTLDYIAPQLYWPVQPAEQSYPVLLEWWSQENVKGRHLWPGLALYKLPLTTARRMRAADIVEEIQITRSTPGATGHIHFNATVIMQNVDGIADRLAELYAEPVLVPASPWLDRIPPGRPFVAVSRDSLSPSEGAAVRFAPQNARQTVRWWVLQLRVDGKWSTTIIPGADRRYILRGDENTADLVSLIAVDRSGNASAPTVLRQR